MLQALDPMQRLPDCILGKIVGFSGCSGAAVLLPTCKAIHHTASLSCEYNHLKETRRAVQIQRFWRRSQSTTAIVKRFLALKLSLGTHMPMTFTELCPYLREGEVINGARALFFRLGYLSNGGKAMYSNRKTVRVFCCMWMMHFFPRNTFEEMGTAERAVYNAATDVIRHLSQTLPRVEASATNHFLRDPSLAVMLKDYHRLFFEWKTPDELRLTKRIINAVYALSHASCMIEVQRETGNEAEIAFQTARLRGKLGELIGKQPLAAFDTTVGMHYAWMCDVATLQMAASSCFTAI